MSPVGGIVGSGFRGLSGVLRALGTLCLRRCLAGPSRGSSKSDLGEGRLKLRVKGRVDDDRSPECVKARNAANHDRNG